MAVNALKVTSERVQSALSNHRAYEKVDDFLYIVKQGSTFVSIRITEMGEYAVVRFIAHLLKGSKISFEMAMKLLGLNAVLKFGAFSYVPQGDLVLFSHTLLGGETLDEPEIITCLEEVSNTADKWDNKLSDLYGGTRMEELVHTDDLDGVVKDIEDIAMFEFPDTIRGKIRSFLRTFFA